jgi:membrane protease YdiL (CAAX protease family)
MSGTRSIARRRALVLLGALLAGGIVLVVGNLAWGVFFALNRRWSPTIPWSVAPALLCLALYWWYLSGGGPPAAARAWRRESLRAVRLGRSTWGWALLAGAAGLACVSLVAWAATLAGAIAPRHSLDAHGVAPATLALFVLTNALVAGVVEEAAFRGYMQVPLERALGRAAAAVIVGAAFALSHLTHAWVAAAHLPFYFAASVAYSLLAMRAGSILPGIVLHASGDALLPLLRLSRVAAMTPAQRSANGIAITTALVLALGAAVLGAWAYGRIGVAKGAAPT